MLSVAAHASDPSAAQVAFAAMAAADRLDHGREIFYIDFIFASLGPDARAALEQLMATSPRPRFHSEFLRKHFDELMAEEKAKGKAEGKAEVLLKQLKLKGFRLSRAERRRVLACTDLDTLDAWTARVLTATSVREVLAPA